MFDGERIWREERKGEGEEDEGECLLKQTDARVATALCVCFPKEEIGYIHTLHGLD